MISITFKDTKFSDWASTFEAIKNVIRDEFMRHEEIFTSDSLNPVEQDYLSRMQSDELSDVEYTRALMNLGRMLENIISLRQSFSLTNMTLRLGRDIPEISIMK